MATLGPRLLRCTQYAPAASPECPGVKRCTALAGAKHTPQDEVGWGSASRVPWGDGLEKGYWGRLRGEAYFKRNCEGSAGLRHPALHTRHPRRPRATSWA